MPEAKLFYSVAELAQALGISRIAVFKKIKSGQLPAHKVGRAYVIAAEHAEALLKRGYVEALSTEQMEAIDRAVKKVVAEYGETLRLLGKE